MIDEKKLIKDIEDRLGDWEDAAGEYRRIGDVEGVAIYERRAVELKVVLKKIQEQPKVGEWIPCSERLPDELVAVNVTWVNRCPENYYMHIKDKPFTDTAILHDGEWRWWDSTIIDYLKEYGGCIGEIIDESIDILAWQPLPKPWEGKE